MLNCSRTPVIASMATSLALERARGGVPGPQHGQRGQHVVALDRLDGQLLAARDRRQVLRRAGPVDHRRPRAAVRSSVCSGSVVSVASAAASSAPRSIGPVVSRSSESDLRRNAAAGRRLRLVVVLVVVVLVVVLVVVVAAEQPVGELAQPLGDLVHRGGGDDQQAEERQQGEQDDGDDRAHAGDQRRADGPADQPAGAGHARARGRRGRRRPGRCRAPTRSAHSQPITSRPRASGRGPRRSSRSAAKNRTTGSTMTSEPMTQRTPSVRADADRADAVAPGGGAEHDRPGRGRPGRRRRGGARGRAARPPPGGRPSGRGRRRRGRAGPSCRWRRATGRSRASSSWRAGGGGCRTAWRAAASCSHAVEPERPREDAGRRVDVVRAGMRRTVIARRPLIGQAEASCPGPASGTHNVTDMSFRPPPPRQLADPDHLRARRPRGRPARRGGRRRRRRVVVGVPARPRAAGR